ncbi:hypothetical protein KY329_05135 [Candidatus Woesearchaeota archaeon]|nr:hypothetical protein [Candidatus Woesearchaeota archaeon]
MNRKGDLGNTVFLTLVAVSFVIFTFSLILSYNQLFNQESKIGYYQEAVLRTNGDAALIESYLKDSARMASDAAIEDLQDNFDAVLDCGKGSFRTNLTMAGPLTTELNCITLNTLEDHTDICLPDILYEYQSRLYQKMSAYIDNYNSVVEWELPSKFEAYPMGESGLSVVFLDPANIPLKIGANEIGMATFRPAFTIPDITIGLKGIYKKEFFDNLQVFAEECAYVPQDMMDDCIRDIFGTPTIPEFSTYYGFVNGQYVFSKWMAGAPRCFALHIPASDLST